MKRRVAGRMCVGGCIVDGLHCTCTVIQVNVGGVIKCKGQNVCIIVVSTVVVSTVILQSMDLFMDGKILIRMN